MQYCINDKVIVRNFSDTDYFRSYNPLMNDKNNCIGEIIMIDKKGCYVMFDEGIKWWYPYEYINLAEHVKIKLKLNLKINI